MIKALFLDIDGTLVSFKTHSISQSTIDALGEARKRGVQIFIATGRPAVLINNLSALQNRGLIDGYITMNGSYCYIGDEVIYQKPMNRDDVKTLMEYCRRENHACVVIDEKDAWVYQPNEIFRELFYRHLQADPFPSITPEQVDKLCVYQLSPFFPAEREREIVPHLHHSAMLRWHPAFMDVAPIGNTKENGIDIVAQHFGFSIEETMAIGDGGNDIGMIRHAGIGVAMGNATADVQAAADWITASVDEDGVPAALRHFGII